MPRFDRPLQQLQGLRTLFDVWAFRRHRADYFEYLSDFMSSVAGQRTLKEIFEQDARRYGPRTTRGRLSAQWARTYPMAGGDLYATWRGAFPEDELVIVRVAQLSGNASLIDTLADLSQAQRLVRQSSEVLISTLATAVAAVLVWVAMVLLVPAFTVPRLQDVFSSVPPAYYGAATRQLFAFSAWVSSWWVWVIILMTGSLVLAAWSFPNLVGPLRRWLDPVLFWRLYRCVAAIRFLSVLHVVLNQNDAGSTQLRTAITLLCRGGSRWSVWHLKRMTERIDRGWVGAATFDTGLFDRSLYWYLQDMSMTRGLVTALGLCKSRLAGYFMKTVGRQAAAARWVMLLCCVASLLGLGLWHYMAIDELRRALMIFYASQ